MIEVHSHIYSLHPDMMGDCNENLEMQICQLCRAGFRTSKFLTKVLKSLFYRVMLIEFHI